MPNQMIALQARAPQGNPLGNVLAQSTQMVNMARQMAASERQNAIAAQQLEIARAKEGREAALAGPQLDKARAEAESARIKYVMDFFDSSALAIANVRDAEQANLVGERLKQLFPEEPLRQSVDETLASIPKDPAQFSAWQESALRRTLEASKQLERDFTTQNLGTSTRVISTPKYGRGTAEVVPGSEAAVAFKPTVVNVEGIGAVIVDPNTGRGYPAAAGDVGGFKAPPVGGGGLVGGERGGGGNGYDVVYGFGDYAKPDKPLTSMTLGEVQDFQRNKLIPATRGKVGAGPDMGTGAVGKYQIVYSTLQEYAPRVLGANWKSQPFTPEVQERIAEAIYNDKRGGNLKKTWQGLPNNKPGEYANVPWSQVRDKIAQVESGGSRGVGAPGAAPRTLEQAASAQEKQRKVKTFQELTGVNLETDEDPVSALIKGSTGGLVEAIGAEIVGAIPEQFGGGATKGMEKIGALEALASTLTLAFAPGGRLSTGVSNEDRKKIEQQLGKIEDPKVPTGKRLAAWREVKAIMARSIGLTPKPATPPAKGNIPQGAIDMLRKNPSLRGAFDQKYGAGAAARVLGGR